MSNISNPQTLNKFWNEGKSIVMYSMIPKPTNVSSILFEIQELEIDTDLAQICFPSHSGFRSYQRLGTAVFPMFVRKVSRRSKTGLKNIKPTAASRC